MHLGRGRGRTAGFASAVGQRHPSRHPAAVSEPHPTCSQLLNMCRELGLGNSRLPASERVFSRRVLPDGCPASALQLHLLLQGWILQQGEVPWVLLANLPSAFQSSRQADLACSGQVSRQQANQASLAFTVSVFLAVVQAGNTHTRPPNSGVRNPREITWPGACL